MRRSSREGALKVWEELEYVEHKPPVCPRSCHDEVQDDNLFPSASVSYISTGSVWDSDDDCNIDDFKDVTTPPGNQVNIHTELLPLLPLTQIIYFCDICISNPCML